ncbi:MAG: type II toxin-antitoxin system PemK/MazF family toxin [Candidatus Pacearchaeota archaeon]
MEMVKIKRGDIVLTNMEPVVGSEQGGIRPALIIQNDLYNEYSPVAIIAAITSKIYKKEYPTNVFLEKEISNLDKNSTILLNQIRTIDKSRILKKISSLDHNNMKKIEAALKISLDLD